MQNIAVVGAQWGDEGKGKIVDLLCERFHVVARFQGGPNAGHTVTIGPDTYALHHVPSGVFRPETKIVIGNGTVIDLAKLITELDGLAEAGIDLDGRLFISDRAHVILPPLQRLDAVECEAHAVGGGFESYAVDLARRTATPRFGVHRRPGACCDLGHGIFGQQTFRFA